MNETVSHLQPNNQVLEVTPDLAASWLDKNECNRPINWSYVSQLARDMKAGHFPCTHQGIAFDPQGRLIDGQHRLWAVVEAEVTVQMRVFFNEPTRHLVYIDGNCPRQRAHRMSLNRTLGTVRADELATLRTMLGGISLTARRRTIDEEMELLEKHRPAIRFTHEHLATRRPAGIANATTRAAIARAWYYAPSADTLGRFCEVLRTGAYCIERERAIILLRDQLLGLSRQATTQAARHRQYALTTRALAAYLDNQPLTVLRAATYEQFLLPEEAGIAAA